MASFALVADDPARHGEGRDMTANNKQVPMAFLEAALAFVHRCNDSGAFR